ncbi:MAG TPA: hypothetical protein PKG60_08205 [Spirochaetota bacterium]|nr:hypothetical protein [Spirochaetota bacterium]HPS85987.1 hypothetical protein [Spirochaetota bacterium]
MSTTFEKKDIVEVLKSAAVDNKLACTKVFEIINEHSVFPDIAGFTMNQYKIKINFCQLGLFGYPEGKKILACETVSEILEDRIYSQIEDGKLPCAAAWHIASELEMKKLEVTAACEKLGIKINKCQLGAF